MNDRIHAVDVSNLGKDFGSVRALNDVSFTVDAGSYFVLLGPSGGGKTTILRLIGGFERPTRGRIRLSGQDVTDIPPNDRGTSMVFQSFALFPHMSVERNVGYGLKLRKTNKTEIHDRVNEMLKMVGLTGLNQRMPNELSGGQQQRVQLARSLVLDTEILLLDEPLASLDANLRKEMCLELKHIQEQVGITFIHVTHNQEEAMTIADRIAVIAGGDLIEEATPKEIYETPRTSFTAQFIGENNLMHARVTGVETGWILSDIKGSKVRLSDRDMTVSVGDQITLSIRSEKLSLVSDPPTHSDIQALPVEFVEQVYLGLTTHTIVQSADGAHILVRQMSAEVDTALDPGTPLLLTWRSGDALLHVE